MTSPRRTSRRRRSRRQRRRTSRKARLARRRLAKRSRKRATSHRRRSRRRSFAMEGLFEDGGKERLVQINRGDVISINWLKKLPEHKSTFEAMGVVDEIGDKGLRLGDGVGEEVWPSEKLQDRKIRIWARQTHEFHRPRTGGFDKEEEKEEKEQPSSIQRKHARDFASI